MPSLVAGDVLVKVHAAGVNPLDWKIREGYMKAFSPLSFPYTMGQDFAGEIVEVGAAVTGFQKGERVFGFAQGADAEFATAKASAIAKVPETVDDETAAALPLAGLTAYQLIVDAVKADTSTTILIHGAAGGVGSIAVQIAKHRGARVLANASQKDAEYLGTLGVDRVIAHEQDRFDQVVTGVDAVIDLVGGDTLERSFGVVKKGGVLVSTVAKVDETKLQQSGIAGRMLITQRDGQELEALVDLVARRIVKPKVSQIMPLAEAKAAEDMSQQGKAHGKIVLKVD